MEKLSDLASSESTTTPSGSSSSLGTTAEPEVEKSAPMPSSDTIAKAEASIKEGTAKIASEIKKDFSNITQRTHIPQDKKDLAKQKTEAVRSSFKQFPNFSVLMDPKNQTPLVELSRKLSFFFFSFVFPSNVDLNDPSS